MKIERSEVERLLAWARIGEIAIQAYGHPARMAESEVIAELCRTWLAVQDAPVGLAERIDSKLIYVRGDAVDSIFSGEEYQRVRLVRDGGES